METTFNYWIMQEPRKNAHKQDFKMIARHSDYDEAKRVVLRELALKKRTYMRAVKVKNGS
tara:strand:+ start:370 stop:549 length:180 start_codon:yes stop_codon:yes gene_type:complete